jgi:hypothetical protein
MTAFAFAFITSKAVVVRTVAAIRSLEAAGAFADAVCVVLCLDESARQIIGRVTSPDYVQVLTVADIPETAAFANRPISRFAVACKPYVLRWALTVGGASRALYFDSDIWFVSDPSFLFDELDTNDVLIVPFMLSAEATIKNWSTFAKNAQRTGYYNAGFVGASDRAGEFLDWWADRCAYSTFRDFYEDISGDQKYLNWVPMLFDRVRILRHYGLNVKPWITQHVPFERCADGTARLNGDPLVYFHFSQDLGNLTRWPEEFYPEVIRYLDDLEQARIDSGQSYVDMPQRDNSDLKRPLLPKSGKLATAIKIMSNYQKPIKEVKRRTRTAIVRGAHLLAPAAQEVIARQYLGRWNLTGDARIEGYETVVDRLGPANPGEPLLFMGASRLAFYLAYVGYPVVIYDPFQGHYNRDLNLMFNLQWNEAQEMRQFLNLEQHLTLERVPVTEVAHAPAPGTLCVSARRPPGELGAALEVLLSLPTLKRLVMVFDPDWSPTYRETFQALIQSLLAGRSVTLEPLRDMDLYRIG